MSSLQTPTRRSPQPAQRPDRPDRPSKSLSSVAQVFLCDLGAKALWSFAGLALIRFLHEDEYADLTLVLALSSLMVEGISGNLNRLYIVGHAKLDLQGSLLAFLTLQFSVLAVVLAVMGAVSGEVGGLFALIAALAFAGSLLAFVKTMLQRELKFWSFSLVELARTLLFLPALVVLMVFRGDHVRAWEVLLLQGICLTAVAAVALVRNLDPACLGQPRHAWRLGRRIVTSGYAMMLGYVLVLAVFARVDVLMLKMLDSPLELATYGAAFRYYGMLTLLLAAVHTVLLPLTQQATHRLQLEAIFAKYRRLVWAVVPLILLGAWLAQGFIPWIDGGRYPGTVDVFRVLSLSTIIGLAYSPYANLLFRYEAFAFLFGLAIVAFVVNVGLNALLIPRFHALGAAMALCIATGLVNFTIYLKARSLMASSPLPANPPDALALTLATIPKQDSWPRHRGPVAFDRPNPA